jgi:extracellular elastinolytic metalloproteinase
MSVRSKTVRVVLLSSFLVATTFTAFAQSSNSRAYRRPTKEKGSPARPLTPPSAGAPSEIAAEYLRARGKEASLRERDVEDVVVTSTTHSAHNGITHVYLRQRANGLEVFGADSNFNIAANGAILSYGTSFLPDINDAVNRTAPVIGAIDAARSVAASAGLEVTEPFTALEIRAGVEQETILSDGGIASSPLAAKLVYQPVSPKEVRLAWQVDLEEATGSHLWRMTVDAETGEVLNKEDYVNHDDWNAAFDISATRRNVRVAKASGPLGMAALLASPSSVADGSSYRVFALPKESPNDGPRTLVSNPADSVASPFGWHDTNGAAGAEFTLTRGNNVHAYLDQDANNQPDAGTDVDGGATLTFDFPVDFNEHAQSYRPAVTTSLFYWNNIIHDVLYQYGFNEASGNFQANNYGRGGLGGDYVRGEAADGNGVNNANFSTPTEPTATGGVPRMQMFLWPGNQFGAQNQVVVDNLGSFDALWSRFSPAPTVAGTAGRIINAGNGCVAADYAGAPAEPWMAIVTGSNTGCQNIVKSRTAQNAGAVAVIVAHTTTATATPILTGSLTTPGPGIPVVSIGFDDGNTIRGAIASGPTTGSVRKHPSHPGIRDGDFESGIMIHEYGHGVSNRLTGGPAVNCLGGEEQAGEGWSDYYALTMLLNPAVDDPEGPRGMGPYAIFQNSRQGNGIRPRPYSRNMSIQPFTYDSLKNGGWLNGGTLVAPHGIGHGWASILWDMTWDLIDKHGFNANVYAPWNTGGNNRSLQYVTDGLKLQGCNPGFVAARNAIIAATEALGGEDTCTVWASFARRGLGYSALQGGTGRDDNSEAFDTHPSCRNNFSGSVSGQPTINVVNTGVTVPLSFSYAGAGEVLASNSPYSRQVDCNTLRTVDPTAQFITPRPIPVPLETPGGAGLDGSDGDYTYPWKTKSEWAGSCREAVLTRFDGTQNRAYFRFDSGPSFSVSGYVRNDGGQPVANAAVTINGTMLGSTVTDATGFYSFARVPRGTYTATAKHAAGGCLAPATQSVTVSRPTTLNFTMVPLVDAFGYRCAEETAAFEEAATSINLVGDDAVRTITLPFPFTFYGQSYTRAHVVTNGYVELVGPAAADLNTWINGRVPDPARPNGAIYPFWDDFIADAASSIRAELKGTAPNQRFVIEYRNVHFWGSTERRIDFNVVLHENGEIVTQYRGVNADYVERGFTGTFGIENHDGTVALQYSFDVETLPPGADGFSIRYRPPTP